MSDIGAQIRVGSSAECMDVDVSSAESPVDMCSRLWSNHNWRSREEIEWKSPLKQRPPRGGNFEPDGQREYMQLYFLVRGGAMCRYNPKKKFG